MVEKFRTGIVQMQINCDFSDVKNRKVNVDKACEVLKMMAEYKPDLIVFPDEFYAGLAYGPTAMIDTLDFLEEELFIKFKEIAKEHNFNIVGGIIILKTDEDLKADHIGFLINNKGEFLGYQEKIHLINLENVFVKSGEILKTFDTNIGKIGIVVGEDILYPEIARNLALMGAEILIAPIVLLGNKENLKIRDKYPFPNNLYKTCALARAMENQIFVIMVNGTGLANNDLKLTGNSVVCSPLGFVYEASNEEDFSVIELYNSHIEEAKGFMSLLKSRDSNICTVNQ